MHFCQNEKLQLLVDKEKRKIRGLEDEHTLELNEWRDKLACRKEVRGGRREEREKLQLLQLLPSRDVTRCHCIYISIACDAKLSV